MKQLIKNIKILSTFILVISLIGCEENDAVLPKVSAGFTYTVNQDLGKVTFINISENADNYEWSFGDGTSSTEINPTKIYPTGEYTVMLKSTNISGATETFEDKVYINIPIPVRLPINFDTENVKYGDVVTFPAGNTFQLVENPDPSGSNTSTSMVGEITNNGVNFEGFFYDLDAPIDLTNNKTIKMNLWSNVALDVLLKLEEGTSGPTELLVSHGGTGWEEMIFTFTASSASYNRLTLFVDAFGTTAGKFYIDDIEQVATIDVTAPTISLNGDAMVTVIQGETFTDPGATAVDDLDGDISANIVVGGATVDVNTLGTYVITYNVSDAAGNAATEVTRTVEVVTPPTSPPTSAPVPPAREAGDVVSIYGGSYATIAVGNYDPNWGQWGHMQVNTAFDPGDGNLVLAYPNFNYQGTDFGAAGPVNASTMEFLHVDIWVASTVTNRMIKISPINAGGSATGAVEVLIEVPVTPGKWNSVDIPKSAFTGMTWDSVVQMKFDGQFNADGSANLTDPIDIYLDNIYFYKSPSSGGGGSSGNIVSIYNNDFTDISVNEWGPFWGDSSARIVDGTLNGSPAKVINMEGGKTFAGIDFSSSAFDATNFTTFHIDYKVDVLLPGQVFNIKLSNHEGGSGETSAIQYTHVPTSTDIYSLSIPLADFVAASDPENLIRNAIAQIVISAARTDTTQGVNITIDNIYFSE
ncbi:PKD domain-containing protein [Tenacibaculum sp. 190130A14a]|uniref:PKD domain-containing protein n=1 Tax=Tenacibaculum polynesiense TaxID=3137857 RepID=A0ABM9PGE0_9FLAO